MHCRAVSTMRTMSNSSSCVSRPCVHNLSVIDDWLDTEFTIERYRYQQDDIVMLTDDSRNPRQVPTRANMIQAMQWLVADARPDDALFFH